MSHDTEIPERVVDEVARLERRSLALRFLSAPVAIVLFTVVMMTWGGTGPFDVIAMFVCLYAIIAAQLVSWHWREKAHGRDRDGKHRYWWWYSIIFGVGMLAISVWLLVIDPITRAR